MKKLAGTIVAVNYWRQIYFHFAINQDRLPFHFALKNSIIEALNRYQSSLRAVLSDGLREPAKKLQDSLGLISIFQMRYIYYHSD